MGISTEDQQRWDERTADLRQINAKVRWVSAGPLLGRIVDQESMRGIDWVVVEGESGPHSRPMHPEWAMILMRQCAQTHTPFLFKQWGDWEQFDSDDLLERCAPEAAAKAMPHSAVVFELPNYRGRAVDMWRVGKGKTGRMLAGRLHDAYPAR
jgi:protein gp37